MLICAWHFIPRNYQSARLRKAIVVVKTMRMRRSLTGSISWPPTAVGST